MNTSSSEEIKPPAETITIEVTERTRASSSFLDRLKKLFKRNGERDEDLMELVNAREEGTDTPLSPEEKALVAAALEFSTQTADSVSIPRADMVTLHIDTCFKETIKTFADCQHSRLPVIRDNLDDIIGFITLKDMSRFINNDKTFKLSDNLRPCTFVPDNLSVAKVLEDMRKEKVQMAIVVDEYGGTSGLITLKDIIEVLVGEMEDEHETSTPEMITPIGEDKLALDPRLPIEDLEEHLNAEFILKDNNDVELERDFETVGGLVFAIARRVPEIGESFTTGNSYHFTIIDADGRRLKKIELSHNPDIKTNSYPPTVDAETS